MQKSALGIRSKRNFILTMQNIGKDMDGDDFNNNSGISLLAYGYPERVGIIHAAGEGIVPELAAGFIQSYMEARGLI